MMRTTMILPLNAEIAEASSTILSLVNSLQIPTSAQDPTRARGDSRVTMGYMWKSMNMAYQFLRVQTSSLDPHLRERQDHRLKQSRIQEKCDAERVTNCHNFLELCSNAMPAILSTLTSSTKRTRARYKYHRFRLRSLKHLSTKQLQVLSQHWKENPPRDLLGIHPDNQILALPLTQGTHFFHLPILCLELTGVEEVHLARTIDHHCQVLMELVNQVDQGCQHADLHLAL